MDISKLTIDNEPLEIDNWQLKSDTLLDNW